MIWLMAILKVKIEEQLLILCDKVFNNAKHLKYDGYQRALPSMVYKYFDKKSLDRAV